MRTLALAIVCTTVCIAALAQGTPLDGRQFTLEVVESGRAVPFSLSYPEGKPAYATLVAESGARSVNLSLVGSQLYGVLPPDIPTGKHTFTIKGLAPDQTPTVQVTRNGQDKIDVAIAGEPLTTYHYSHEDRKPYLWPLEGEGGASLTRDYPFVEGGKTKDHPHHVSFWTAHGDLNGADYWEYGERTGWQISVGVPSGSGEAVGHIAAENKWVDKDRKPVVDEQRTYLFYNTPASARIIDVDVTFTANYGDVKFGDTKEGGIVGLRMNDDLRETGGTGKITTSEGAVGEKAAWGKPAAWCDYSGTLEGFGVRGITVMNHPSSFRYPIHWHVRAYGLLGANAFGYSDFTGGKENGEYTLMNGESIEFKFRIYLHSGDVEAADVAGYFKDYATPPAAEWVK